MAHHSAHPRTLTITLPSVPWRRLARGTARRARRFEQKAARHWPFVAYALLTFSVAGYVIAQLSTMP